jgi:hypothetical protein
MLKQHKGGWTLKIGRLLISRKNPCFRETALKPRNQQNGALNEDSA